MSYSKSLRNTLKDKNEVLYNKLQPIETAARSVLTYTASAFPYYTPHDFNHSTNVEEILNWLVIDDIKLKMNEYEIFFLIIAAWLHDWGMVAKPDENPEEVRKQHNIRTEANFEKFHNLIGLSNAEARIVGRICRGHREDDIFDQKYEDQFFGSKNKLVKIRFLTSLLRIADEIDVTENRTPEIVYFTLRPQGASREEFEKHLAIGGIGPIAPHKLRLSGVAKTPKGVQVIEDVRAKIQSQIDSVKTILIMNGIPLDSIETRIDTRGFINKPIAFELERKTIVDLLIGSFLYSRKDTAIRELVQNAVDICRLKKVISPEFDPTIEIEFDKEKISVEDNGIGMNFEEASAYFSKKGSSFYVSDDLKKLLKGKDFDPINKFGIGVLSSFMIANKMMVDTKKENCAPCRFIIDDISEGWTYETGGRDIAGTKVTLFLNEEGKKIDVVKALDHYVKNVPISVFVKDLEKNQKSKFSQQWNFDIPEVKELIRKEFIDSFVNMKPDLILEAKNDYFSLKCCYYKEDIFKRDENCVLLNHGLFVGIFEFFEGFGGKWLALINCTSDIIDFKVSREDVVENIKYMEFLEKLYYTFLDLIQSHVEKEFGSKKEVEKYVTYSKLLHEFFNRSSSIVDDQKDALLASEIFKNRIFAVGKSKQLRFMSGEEIQKAKFSKIIHYKLPLELLEEHITLIYPEICSKLLYSEAVVFDTYPHFLLKNKMTEENNGCHWCSKLKDSSTKCECTDLPKVIEAIKMEKRETPIDCLLPVGSFFSQMPSYIRGLAIQAKPFEFDKLGTAQYKEDIISRIAYGLLVGVELFSDIPDLEKDYRDTFTRIKKDSPDEFALKERGYFIYDADDPFISFIISNSERILTNEFMKRTLNLYFRTLAVNCLGGLLLRSSIISLSEVIVLEKVIADFLGFANYVSPSERSGKLVPIYITSKIL